MQAAVILVEHEESRQNLPVSSQLLPTYNAIINASEGQWQELVALIANPIYLG